MATWDSGNGAAASSGTAVTVPSGTNRLGLFALSFEYDSAPTSVTATLGGEALTALDSGVSTAGGGTEQVVYAFYADEALLTTIGTGSKTLSFSVTGGSGHQGFSSLWEFIVDAAQSAPASADAGSSSNTDTPTVTINPAAASAVAVAFVGHNAAAATATAGSGYTIDYDAGSSGGDARGVMQHDDNPATGSQACSMTLSSSTRWAIVAVVVEAAASGGATATSGRKTLLGVGR
jgi:hypothetical protein